MLGEVAEIGAIETHHTVLRIVEPHDEREDRALTRAAGSNECVFFPLLDMEAHILNSGFISAVVEAHIL